MTTQGRRGVEAFVDRGFPDQKTFCTQFLYSAEFTANTLQSLVKRGKSKPKYNLATNLTEALANGTISPEEILLAFVQQPRKWLSLKLGPFNKYPTFTSARDLLIKFGDETWYGPVEDASSLKKWYIRTTRVPFYEQTYQAEELPEEGIAEKVSSLSQYSIRWTVIAELGDGYVALSWNGFRSNEPKAGQYSSQLESPAQFQYWKYIPKFFRELSQECNANWRHPILHKLVLQDLWDKYLRDPQYVWRHLRIRADNRGVALNAHSTGVLDKEELTMRGLQALSKQLACSALGALNIEETPKTIDIVEGSLLRTLIQEWGTKSYEFSLDGCNEENKKQQGMFRAHCYFANGPISSSPQDSLQHLHCFIRDYGGSSQALSFLLAELGD